MARKVDQNKAVGATTMAKLERGFAEGSASLNEEFLDAAREAAQQVRVVAIVLILPDGARRLVAALPAFGDETGEGLEEMRDRARDYASAMEAGEALEVALREVSLGATRLVSTGDVTQRIAAWQARRAERSGSRGPVTNAPEMDALREAREMVEPPVLCLNMLILANGERRVACSDLEWGDGEGLDAAKTFAQHVRMTKLLRPGEQLDLELRECPLDATRVVQQVRF